jgi:hypothetical protein
MENTRSIQDLKKELSTTNHFIEKFTKIPNRKWTTDKLWKEITIFGIPMITAKCALGHCLTYVRVKDYNKNFGYLHDDDSKIEINKLIMLFYINLNIEAYKINNSKIDIYNQEKPKERILAALKNIKNKLEKEISISNEKIHYKTVYIDSTLKVKNLIMSN